MTNSAEEVFSNYFEDRIKKKLYQKADKDGWLYGISTIATHCGLTVSQAKKSIGKGQITAFQDASGKWESNTAWVGGFLEFPGGIVAGLRWGE